MLRLLSWSSGLAADKITHQEANYLAPHIHRSTSIDLQNTPMLKRKRSDSGQFEYFMAPTKPRMEKISPPVVEAAPAPTKGSLSALPRVSNAESALSDPRTQALGQGNMENAHASQDWPTDTPTKAVDKETLRQTLNSQISLEILLKHNELRLIDQEIAKCQIALEQLRRCTEIPFPVTRISPNVSQGQGPVVRSSRSSLRPESPAPWGVTDGPYTRHYAKWLLPDPLFDGGDLPGRTGLKTPAGKTPTKGRSTRGSFADPGSATSQSKAQRAGKFQALSSGYPQPKDKTGPMMQKRKSDGVLVKLICLDCRRDNFSSAQGFINHCRIAHGRNFASHDAAADACGEPVDVDEAGVAVGIEGPPSASTAGLVNPLIYSAHLLKQSSATGTSKTGFKEEENNPILMVSPKSHRGNTPKQTASVCLTPSPLTPNLSTWMQRQGTNLDLQSLVADMKTSVPVDDSSESEGEEVEDTTMEEAPPVARHPHVTGSMQPARSVMSEHPVTLSSGGKGPDHRRMPRTGADQPLPPSCPQPSKGVVTSTYVSPAHCDTLERSPTNDSNQAPSLVDDDGDDEYEAHSPSYSVAGSVDGDNRDLDFEVEDGDENGPPTRNRSTDSDYSGTPKQHPPQAPTRRASAFRRSISGREEKHVSFVSPSPAREAEPSKNAGDRKRRRTGRG